MIVPVEQELPVNKIFIAGEWRKGQGAEIESRFSANNSLNLALSGASHADASEAIERAVQAQKSAQWTHLKPHERATFLYEIARGISENIDRIAYIQSCDTGKTLGETRALALSAAGTFCYYAAVCETTDELLTVPRGDFITYSVHQPLGVVAAITPWNSPIASDAQKIAPALAAGNSVILKPASWSPLVSLELARIIEKAGLPKGVFSVVPGSGREIGNLLVEHSDIARVSFTGGTSTGKMIARQSAEKLMPVSLELGGKSPTIVFDDCDIDQAISGILFGIFSSSGQACIAGSRLFVQRNIYQSFIERLVYATERLKVGHPHSAETQVAPLVHFEHRDSVENYIATAQNEGGNILTGGTRPTDIELQSGAYLLPTIIDGLKNSATACQEEIFGPVLIAMPFENEDEVVSLSNNNEYGLACGIWTKDFPKAWRVGSAITAGTVWINTYKQFSISTPFGGDKASGIGREKGREGMRAYMRQKSFYQDLSEAPHPWARHP